MIKHIVLFKLRMSGEKDKAERLLAIKEKLEALPAMIEPLKNMEVGINCNLAEDYDLALTATLDSMEGLSIYAQHPRHLEAGRLIREILEERACVDYEF